MELAMETHTDMMKIYSEKSQTWKYIKKDKNYTKQLSAIEETLSRFGLLKNEIRVYLYLARSGEKKASEIAEAIALHRTETYRILRDLEKKGIVFSVFAKPLKFTAVPLDKAIDMLVEAQKMKIKLLEKEKENLVELWLSIPQPKMEKTPKELFQMLQGEQQVVLKAEELLEKTERELQLFAPAEYLAHLYYSDFTDKLKKKLGKINIILLVENSPKSIFFIEQMQWPKHKYKLVNAQKLPCFMISDKKELLIAFQDEDNAGQDEEKRRDKTAAIWTNYNAFIWTLQMLFLKLMETEAHETLIQNRV
ncbi:MAG: helix-turn-helix domain-containing protein [Candidatus Bathyarchaeota archaeon]|nr:helix-turn-helix domain-containing protein [Candidatus Bathyarchaeota archaeon]